MLYVNQGRNLGQLPLHREGKLRQISSYHTQGEESTSLHESFSRKSITIGPGETHVMADITGAGCIVRLWITTPRALHRHLLRKAVLRFYWDGEGEPSVECPLGDFFGAPFARYKPYASAPLSLTGGGYICWFPMPFADGARLEIENESHRPIPMFSYQATYYELPEPPHDAARFHAQWRRQSPTVEGQPYVILDAEGEGHFVGCNLNMQSVGWWLKPPFMGSWLPGGFGLGMLEGGESIVVDGEETPSIRGTGTEDYFNSGWHFSTGPFAAPTHGCTVKSYRQGRVAAYRFHFDDAVPFSSSIRVQIDHGLDNGVAADYSSVAYWYQREPHKPFGPLPRTRRRLPRSTLLNQLQFALLYLTPSVVLTIGGLVVAVLALLLLGLL